MKLKIEFIYPENLAEISSSSKDQNTSVPANLNALRNKMPSSDPSTNNFSANTSPDTIFSELQSLRKKYDDVIAYTVHLTAERDSLIAQYDESRRELNREISRRKASETSKTQKPEKVGESKKVVQQVNLFLFIYYIKKYFKHRIDC